jgi:wyosine [tRNA(Phe)-imidazoG37] synthetase (radical SAM superfamily)
MLKENILPDVITFAGNGEPTMHPDFHNIIEDTIVLRDQFCPKALISVLSNATMLHKKEVVDALKKADQNILKLDSGVESTINELNRPAKQIPIKTLIDQFKQFEGNLIIQSMFTSGFVDGRLLDNTQESDIQSWLKCIDEIKPEMVMIYTIDRDTPFEGLQKIPLNKLNQIAELVNKLGIKTQVSG